MGHRRIAWILGAAVAAGMPFARAAPPDAGPLIPLPDADRRTLEQYLGAGVVGEAVAAPAIDDPAAWFGLREGTWKGRIASGPRRGQPFDLVLARSDDDEYGATWRLSIGTGRIDFLRQDDSGRIEASSSIDLEHAVVSRFTPAEPRVLHGMKAGDTHTAALDVRVYDLNHPTRQEYRGSLTLAFSYVGAYRVTVPAGTFDAALLRWHYKGHVGPANIEETVYRLSARGTGPVAWLDLDNVSAFLVYNEHDKTGVVLREPAP